MVAFEAEAEIKPTVAVAYCRFRRASGRFTGR